MHSLAVRIAIISALLLSCATALVQRETLNLFAPAPASDPWNVKVENWQDRHARDVAANDASSREAETSLAIEYSEFSRDLRREIASDTVAWVQEQSREHYRPDEDRDHWATLGEVIESGGDDCDGLDLLTFQLLRRLGFQTDEIYRAIVVEDLSGQHHMVTLWFERGPDDDPFILDPTGVVTSSMIRLSEVPQWRPIELFDESAHFRVEPSRKRDSVAVR